MITPPAYASISVPTAPVGTLASLENGYPFDSGDFQASGRTPLVRIRDLQASTFETFLDVAVPERVMLRDGDVVIGMDGDFNVVRWSRGPAALNQRLCRLRQTSSADLRFVAYALPAALDYINKTQYATTVKHLSSGEILASRVPAPHLEDQRRIADFLDDQTTHIDQIIAARQSQIQRLGDLSVSFAETAVWGGLAAGAASPTGIDPAPLAPAHWERVRNRYLFRERTEVSEAGDEELLSVSHLTGVTPRAEKSVTMFMAESLAGYKVVRPGDLVINTLWAWMGALGVSPRMGIVSPAYGVYAPTAGGLLPSYADGLYRSRAYICEMTRHSKGVWSSRLRLYPESFLSLRALVPPRSEQIAIAQAIARSTNATSERIALLAGSIDLLGEFRRSLTSAAVSGEFDVSTASGRGVPV